MCWTKLVRSGTHTPEPRKKVPHIERSADQTVRGSLVGRLGKRGEIIKHFPKREQHVAPMRTIIVLKSVIIQTVTIVIRTKPARSIFPFITLPWIPILLSMISTEIIFKSSWSVFGQSYLFQLTNREKHNWICEK